MRSGASKRLRSGHEGTLGPALSFIGGEPLSFRGRNRCDYPLCEEDNHGPRVKNVLDSRCSEQETGQEAIT